MIKRGISVEPAAVITAGLCPVCGANTTLPKSGIKGYCRRCYVAEYNKSWHSLPDVIAQRKLYGRLYDKRRYPFIRMQSLRQRRSRERQDKLNMIVAYGGKCECCGETGVDFLTIDHINGGGKADRAPIGQGAVFYRHLRRLGYPKDKYRLLCMNCNFALGKFGHCLHDETRRAGQDMLEREATDRLNFAHLMQDDLMSQCDAESRTLLEGDMCSFDFLLKLVHGE